MKTGLPAVIEYVLRGGLLKKSPGSLRSPVLFICLLSKASFARRQIKIPHFVQDFFIRAQDWMVFATLTHHNKLVLPKAPHGFAVTGFLLVCLGK
jgi:hypothetical protein